MINEAFAGQMPILIEILKKYKLSTAYLFGSVITDRFKPDSDIDLLINFQEGLEPLEQGSLMWDLRFDLRDTLNREVDLLTEKSLKNPYFIEELNEKKIKIYG